MAEDYLALMLEKAAADPANKPEFGRALLTSTIFVMGEIEGEDPSKNSRPAPNTGANVVLRSQQTADGRTVVPFFSSLEKLRAFIPSQVNYLAIPARTLFELAKGADVVLNPGSRVWGNFSADDIAKLVAQGGAPPAQPR